MYTLLADTLLALHLIYILLVVIPVPLILIGYPRGWRWVRRPLIRNLHLAAILFLVIQTASGLTCPLTDWEMKLRYKSGQAVYEESFVEHWINRLIFFDWDERFFSILYWIFGLTVAGLYWFYPPKRPVSKTNP